MALAVYYCRNEDGKEQLERRKRVGYEYTYKLSLPAENVEKSESHAFHKKFIKWNTELESGGDGCFAGMCFAKQWIKKAPSDVQPIHIPLNRGQLRAKSFEKAEDCFGAFHKSHRTFANGMGSINRLAPKGERAMKFCVVYQTNNPVKIGHSYHDTPMENKNTFCKNLLYFLRLMKIMTIVTMNRAYSWRGEARYKAKLSSPIGLCLLIHMSFGFLTASRTFEWRMNVMILLAKG